MRCSSSAAGSGPPSHGGNRAAFVLPLFLLLAGVALQGIGQLNHDVAFLSWGARRMLDGAVLGVDLVEVNFPLAFLVYMPPAALSSVVPFPLAIRLWVLVLALLAIALAWRDVPQKYRLVVFSILAAYTALAWPREFAQREQIAMLLVFPYVVPGERRGLNAVLVGVLAAVGFAIKPHFLIAWLAVEFGRKFGRLEQLALVITGLVYALSLVAFFPEFTFGMLPVAMEMYEASDRMHAAGVAMVPFVVAGIALYFSVRNHDAFIRSMALASLGFSIAAILQFKYYNYHLIATYGYSLVALGALLCATQRLQRLFLGGVMFGAIAHQAPPVASWWSDREGRMALAPLILAQLQVDGAKSFISLGVHPYPAFPTAIYYEERGGSFIGSACCSSFLPAAAAGNPRAGDLAKAQFMEELKRRPDVVLVDRDWRRHTNVPAGFDGLAWYLSDPAIAREWRAYYPYGEIGAYVFYRRRDYL